MFRLSRIIARTALLTWLEIVCHFSVSRPVELSTHPMTRNRALAVAVLIACRKADWSSAKRSHPKTTLHQRQVVSNRIRDCFPSGENVGCAFSRLPCSVTFVPRRLQAT